MSERMDVEAWREIIDSSLKDYWPDNPRYRRGAARDAAGLVAAHHDAEVAALREEVALWQQRYEQMDEAQREHVREIAALRQRVEALERALAEAVTWTEGDPCWSGIDQAWLIEARALLAPEGQR